MKPTTSEAWLELLGGSKYGATREEQLCWALERLHVGMCRERQAWTVLLATGLGLGRQLRDVKKALAGTVLWPDPPPPS